jgi:hypothetical protein
MRSGSTEFARDLARSLTSANGSAYDAGEPFNYIPVALRHEWTIPMARRAPLAFLAALASHRSFTGSPVRSIVLKLFPHHLYSSGMATLSPRVCAIVLERSPIDARWCSLVHARRTREWTGRTRHNCTHPAAPSWFAREHAEWFARVRRVFRPHLPLTFQDVVARRMHSVAAAVAFCRTRVWTP